MIVGGWNPEGHPPFVDRKPRPGAFPPWELDPRPGLLLLKSGVNFPALSWFSGDGVETRTNRRFRPI
jgi:hypothetical protein